MNIVLITLLFMAWKHPGEAYFVRPGLTYYLPRAFTYSIDLEGVTITLACKHLGFGNHGWEPKNCKTLTYQTL